MTEANEARPGSATHQVPERVPDRAGTARRDNTAVAATDSWDGMCQGRQQETAPLLDTGNSGSH